MNSPVNMTHKIDDMLLCLNETVILLRENNQPVWADWFEQVHGLITGGDYDGMEQLGTAFGGMGSFNDLVLQSPLSHQEYPYEISLSKEEIVANERLASLRAQMYEILMKIKQENRSQTMP